MSKSSYYECCGSYDTHTAACDFYHGRSHQPASLGSPETPQESPHCENCGAPGVALQELMCRSCWEQEAAPRFHWRDGVYFQRVDGGRAVLMTLPQSWYVIPEGEWASILRHLQPPETPQDLLDECIPRVLELLRNAGITEPDELKHTLEDHARWFVNAHLQPPETPQESRTIEQLSIPDEEELSRRIDEMVKYLAMEQSYTLNGIARLFLDCQRRMSADWENIGSLRRQINAARKSPPETPQDDDYEATVRSIAAMLGWMNLPPRRTLEMDIAALKDRAKNSLPETPQEDAAPSLPETLHDDAMALAYDEADEWTCGYLATGYKANFLAARIEGLVLKHIVVQPQSLLAAPEPADELPEPLAASIALFRENPDAWEAEWQRQHDFKVTLITENERLKALLAAREGRVREIVGRILWSKVTEIGGGRTYLKTHLDDVADELAAALAAQPCPRGHHHFSQGWQMGVSRIGQRCDCGQEEIVRTGSEGIIVETKSIPIVEPRKEQ